MEVPGDFCQSNSAERWGQTLEGSGGRKCRLYLFQEDCKGGRKAGQWAEGSGLKKTLLLPGRQDQMLRWKGRSCCRAICALYVPLILSPDISDCHHHLHRVLLAQTDSPLNPNFRRGSWSPCFLPVLPVNGFGGEGVGLSSGDQPSPPDPI